MKKMLAIILAVALVASLCTTAFAATLENFTGTPAKATDTHDVTLNIPNLHDDTVYNVVVEWDDLDFTYNFDSDVAWQPGSHLYDGDADNAGWTGEGTIKVTNHSNREVDVTVLFDNGANSKQFVADTNIEATIGAATAVANVGVDAGKAANELESADIQGIYGVVSKADAVTYEVTVAGAPTVQAAANDLNLGTITVTVTDGE
jgi:hypothetical protein